MAKSFTTLADKEVVAATLEALNKNGFKAELVETLEQARHRVAELIPAKAEVFNSTSRTLDEAGISDDLNDPTKYSPIRDTLIELIQSGDRPAARKLGAAPDYVVGSVHAITQDGKVLVVSATNSQLGLYTAGAGQVIWVVSTQKIVKDLNEARQRVEEHIFPLEDARSKEAYGVPSAINTEVVFNKGNPDRITLILVNEKAGF